MGSLEIADRDICTGVAQKFIKSLGLRHRDNRIVDFRKSSDFLREFSGADASCWQWIVSIGGLPNKWPEKSAQNYDGCFPVCAIPALRERRLICGLAFVPSSPQAFGH